MAGVKKVYKIREIKAANGYGWGFKIGRIGCIKIMINFFIVALFVIINIAGFILVAVDKRKARRKQWRIREKSFFIVSALGGCVGTYIGLMACRHKIRHKSFMLGIPAIFIAQLLLIYFIYRCIQVISVGILRWYL